MASRTLLVNEGEGGVWDGPKSARDVEAIVRAARGLWGQLPYEKYVFFNLLVEGGGGLEHKSSTVLMASRWSTRTRPAYLGWLDLVSHEFFHTWNVKRLRPVELGPFDYESEVLTKSLWLAEGVTSYYDRLLVRRAGLCTVAEYLEGNPPGATADSSDSKNDIESLQETPGRLVQPLETSSFDSLDQVLPPRRELGQHVDQLLHQGGHRRLPDGRQGPPGDRRRRSPRRRHAAGLHPLLGREGIHPRGVPRHRQRGGRDRPVRLSSSASSNRPTNSTTPRRSPGTASASSRSAVDDKERTRRPARRRSRPRPGSA